MPSEKRHMLRHFLATLEYRASNILSKMPLPVATDRPEASVRSPVEILNHINEVLTHAQACFESNDFTYLALAEWPIEIERFYDLLQEIDNSLDLDIPFKEVSAEQILQGPLADAMIHLGQIGIFRRMAGSPVEAENYLTATISAGIKKSRPI